MTISLNKGGKVNLSKEFAGQSLDQLQIGLGWDTNKYDGGEEFDLDTSVFILDENGKTHNETDFIFYGNTQSANGSVVHQGDNRNGEGEGDDEVIDVTLSKVEATKLAITATIHEADLRNQNFGQVSNAYIRVVNKATGEELLRYDLEEDFSTESAIVVAEIYNKGGDWRFSAVGAGYEGGLAALATSFGLDVA